MAQIQLKQIGYLAKTHGVHGELVLSLNEGFTIDLIGEFLHIGDAVFIEIDGIPVPFFISDNGLREHGSNSILLKFDDLDKLKASKLVSLKVYLEKTKVSSGAKFEEDLASAWIGYEIADKGQSFQGKVKEFIEIKGNPMISIEVGKKNLLIPLLSDFIVSVNNKRKFILLDLPEGYLDAML